jgi:TfoX/Sxy family transcriptional regulator of competence genes
MAIPDELKKQLEPSLVGAAGVTIRDMMGTDAFHVRGRMFAFWMPDGIVVKTPHDGHADLVSKLHSTPFTGPQASGAGEWTRLAVTAENVEDVRKIVDDARRAVAGGTNTAPRRKKRR